MMLHCSRACLLLAAVVLTVDSAGQALINGNFEQPGKQDAPPIGWTVLSGTLIQDSQMRHEGRFSGKIDNYNRSSAAYQDVEVTPGQSYQLTGSWRNGDKTAPFDVVRIEWHWLEQVGGKPVAMEPMIDSGSTVSDWKAFQMGPFTAPPTARGVRITLKSAYGIAAYDELVWRKVAGEGAATPAPAAATAVPARPSTGSSIRWQPDATTAMRLAASQKKPILLFFSSSGGETAKYYLTQVFTDAAVAEYVNGNYLPVNCDLAANRDLAAKLGVVKAGVTLTFDSGGKPLKTIQGHLTASQYLQQIQLR